MQMSSHPKPNYDTTNPYTCTNPTLQKVKNRIEGHVEAGCVRNDPGDGPGRLRDHHHGVDQRVGNAGQGNGTEQIDRNQWARIGQDVEEADHEIRKDVFQIVQVGAVQMKRIMLAAKQVSIYLRFRALLTDEHVQHRDHQS